MLSLHSWRSAASLVADPMVGFCTPLMTAEITEPTNMLVALCHYTVGCALVCFKILLSCYLKSLGSPGVVLSIVLNVVLNIV